MGPLEALNTLSRNIAPGVEPFTLDIITPNGDPAHTGPIKDNVGWGVNQTVLGTHGYHYDPKNPTADLLKDSGITGADFLLIPGGLGPPKDETAGVVEFIKQYYNAFLKDQENKYLFTVCTGSKLAAAAGCLDHIYATTNKSAWGYVTGAAASNPDDPLLYSPGSTKTYWVADARWVDQGPIWTTSGVSAGTDGFVAWMSKTYLPENSIQVTNGMEWNVQSNSREDPFCTLHNCTDKPNQSGLPAYPSF